VLLGVFAAGALLIAAIGIYGVLSYSVSQRTQEIGVRMALGAKPAGVLRLVIGEGMKVGVVGIAIGLSGGLALGRAVSSLVYDVPVRDPATFGRHRRPVADCRARSLCGSSSARFAHRPDGSSTR
jgi:putative ABC transport system permease protein